MIYCCHYLVKTSHCCTYNHLHGPPLVWFHSHKQSSTERGSVTVESRHVRVLKLTSCLFLSLISRNDKKYNVIICIVTSVSNCLTKMYETIFLPKMFTFLLDLQRKNIQAHCIVLYIFVMNLTVSHHYKYHITLYRTAMYISFCIDLHCFELYFKYVFFSNLLYEETCHKSALKQLK